MIEQGHKYLYEGHAVIAMESASRGLVRVRRHLPEVPVIQCGPAFYAQAERLVIQPMKYFQGQTKEGK